MIFEDIWRRYRKAERVSVWFCFVSRVELRLLIEARSVTVANVTVLIHSLYGL